MRVLVAYATAHGSTGEMAEFIGRILRAYSLDTAVENVERVQSIDEYEVVILGSAVHAGMWLPQLSQFIQRFEHKLAEKHNFMWLACIRTLEANSREHILENYVYKPAIETLNIDIEEIGVLAGKITQGSINGDERWLLATQYDGNALPGKFDRDYRDWQHIASWAGNVAKILNTTPVFNDADSPIILNIPDGSGDVVDF